MTDDAPSHGMGDAESDADSADRPAPTTNSGAAISDDQRATDGPRGPAATDDSRSFEGMTQFNRERVPDRIAHAKGGGVYGTFTVTTDEISEAVR